ncbi:hypothetical protein DL770_000652 [Monosporascus sp. CRB-9-2]|nr:hypothetical protein DL770_000652 [Monosporascus sp. CRB-9-2]
MDEWQVPEVTRPDPGDGSEWGDAAPVRRGYPAEAADEPPEARFGTVETAELRAVLTASGSGARFGGICVAEWYASAPQQPVKRKSTTVTQQTRHQKRASASYALEVGHARNPRFDLDTSRLLSRRSTPLGCRD